MIVFREIATASSEVTSGAMFLMPLSAATKNLPREMRRVKITGRQGPVKHKLSSSATLRI